jgi:hypothetical protein
VIHPAFGLAAVTALAVALARNRPAVRPVAVLLVVLLAIAAARAMGPPPRPDAALWISWACVQGVFAWRAWKVKRPGATQALVGGGQLPAAFAAARITARGEDYGRVLGRVHNTLPLACLALPAFPFLPIRWTPLAWHALLVAPHVAAVAVGLVAWAGDRPRTVAQAVSLVLTWSAALDVAIGALAPGAGWVRAAPLAWATWLVVALILAWSAKRA